MTQLNPINILAGTFTPFSISFVVAQSARTYSLTATSRYFVPNFAKAMGVKSFKPTTVRPSSETSGGSWFNIFASDTDSDMTEEEGSDIPKLSSEDTPSNQQ